MANCCSTDIIINFNTEEQAKLYEKHIQYAITRAYIACIGLRLTNDKFLFDADIHREYNSISIYGWVKWDINKHQARRYFQQIQKLNAISATILFEEISSNSYGRYTLHDAVFTEEYLNPNHPFWQKDRDDDDYFDNLYQIFEQDKEIISSLL